MTVNSQTIVFEDNFETYAHNYNLTEAGYVVWEGTARASNADSIPEDVAHQGKVYGKSDSGKNNFALRKTFTLEAGASYTWEIATKIQDGVKYFLQVNPTDIYKKVELNNANWQNNIVPFTVQEGSEEVTLVVYRWGKKVVAFDDFKLIKAVATSQVQTKHDELVIYPNPSTGLLNVSNVVANSSYKIIDSSGKTITEQRNILNQNATIDLSIQPIGIYIMEITSNSGSKKYHRFVLK